MVQGTKGDTMTGELMAKTYANDLWRKRPGIYFQQPKSLLIMDSARAHTSKEATDALGGTNTTTEIIDDGMTPLLQLIDTHINKPFKDHLRTKWNEWMTGGEIQFTASGKRKRASYEMVVNWVNDVWQQVATDNAILKGFKECGYIGYDGDVNSLHSRLRDTIVNREIPPEVLAEVNEFLIQLETERNETGCNLDESFESEDDDNDEDTEDEKKGDDFENDDVDIEVLLSFLLKEMVSLLYLFSGLVPIFLVQVKIFDQIRDFFGSKFLAHGLKTGSLF